ncbi:MAG: hypothetical protein WD078_04510 [Woeseia sp.]
MRLSLNIGKLGLLALLAASLWGCGKDDAPSAESFSAPNSLLQYVADDSPYVFAMVEPLPDDVADKLEPQLDLTLKTYQTVVRQAVREAAEEEKNGEDSADAERMADVLDELAGLLSLEGIREAGLGRESTFVVYGAGLLPVLRARLTDAEAFEEALKRIEGRAGTPMSVGVIDEQPYRYAGNADGRIIIAMIDNDLVVSAFPAGLSDDGLRSLLGLTLPAESMAASGRLQTIATDNGFTAYGAGFMDFERLAAVFLDAPSGINSEILEALEYGDNELSPVCKSEIRSMAGIAPRLLAGYTEISTGRITSNTILELRDDIAAGFSGFSAPVPGLGQDHGGLLSFGMSIDLLAAREFYAARLDALQASPYECELFAEMQAGLEQGQVMLNQPLPPIVYGFKGFLAVIEDIRGFDVSTKQPPTAVDLRFLLATDNAPGLLAMGSMFSPELAAMNLQPDSKPVRLDVPQLQGQVDTAYLALSNNAVALSVGEGQEAGLGAMMAAKAGDPQPFMSMHMDASRYYAMIGDVVAASGSDDSPSSAEMNMAINDIMQGFSELIDRLSIAVLFTDRGIEFPTEVALSD